MKQLLLTLGLAFVPSAFAEPTTINEQSQPAITWLVLDDLAYHIYQDIQIDLENQEVLVLNNDITQCAQINDDPPLNSGGFQLITDTQAIGLTEVIYDFGRKAMILSSETDDLICDGSFEFDRIYVDNFE